MIDFEKALVAVATSKSEYPVSFDDARVWIGYTRKSDAKAVLKGSFVEGTDFCAELRKSTGGRPSEEITLTVDCFKAFCMMAGTEKGREVRAYYLEVEKRFKKRIASELVEKSKTARKGLTAQWARHGLRGGDFAKATVKEYEVAFGDTEIRKRLMDSDQIKVLTVLETLESMKLDRSPEIHGIEDVVDSLHGTGRGLGKLLEKLRITAVAS